MSAIVHLARETGGALREAILADLPRLQREAQRLGRSISKMAPKVVDQGHWRRAGLRSRFKSERPWIGASEASPSGSRNLLAPDESYKDFVQTVVRSARDILHEHGLKSFHELRAAYACERYEQLTSFSAPVNGGRGHREDRELDQRARQQISHELGHNRIDVMSAYIGGRL